MRNNNQKAQRPKTVTKAEFLAGAALRVINDAAAGNVQVIEEDGIPLCVLISPARYSQLLGGFSQEPATKSAQPPQAPQQDNEADAACTSARITPLTETELEEVLREID